MKYIQLLIQSALDDFRRNKMRTFLTSLGILIGVASVVLLIALGLGLKKTITDQFESLGKNLIIVLPGKVFQEGSNFRPGGGMVGGARFDERDVSAIKKLRSIRYVAPAFIKTVDISYQEKTELGDLFASNEEIFATYNIDIDIGRLFTESDVLKRSKIAVLGSKIAEDIYGDKNKALGKYVKIESQRFRIVGIAIPKSEGSFGGPNFDNFIYVPYTSAFPFNPDKTFFTMYLSARDDSVIEQAKDEVQKTLEKRYNDGDFSVVESTQILSAVSSIFAVLNTVLVLIGAISLIVGGIGIMNIMYVSVVERTKEIGIRRAIGATKQDILYQFLSESVLLSLIGGSGGLIVSFIVVILVNRYIPAQIDTATMSIAFLVSTLIGVVFGVIPARKASNLSPLNAIRYE